MAAAQSPSSSSLIIHDVTVIYTAGGAAQAHRSVVVRDDHIVSIVPSAELEKK